MNYKILNLFIFCFLSFSLIAQTSKEKQKITKEYNLDVLENLKVTFQKDFTKEKKNAIILAKKNGWKLKYTKNGSYYELIKVSKNGQPIYYKTDNVDAAKSTRANFMHNNGGLGLNIEGQGMTAYVWDGGLARITHQEFDGIGGDNRYSIGDGTSDLSFHGAHVTGTIMASGFDANAKGMAPQAKVIGHDWNSDLAEATAAAANGMLVSNHSYGYGADDIPDWWFGAYIEVARDWDNLMYNAPYYLQVNSAGNDGNNDSANGAPLEGNSSFDKINGRKVGKNGLTIANGQDATINANGTLASVNRNSGSSEGPTDDLRIKPDLMGNGTGLYSSYESADDAYNTISGTSMASPNVTGSLLLLQQHYNETNGEFMRASTLKGLALHTADDVDINGPDANTGWGLMNTKVAAETITKNGFESLISEEVLSNNGTYSITVKSDGFSPLLASISWTDKPGEINTGTTNDPKAVLVNDLDIKITQNSDEFKPWRLTGVYSNEKGDNLVDPFERVDVANPSGEYTITVSHKGALAEDQKFSLIVTGVSGEFTFLADTSEIAVCSDQDALFNFEYRQAVTGTTQFTTNGVPTGMTTTFSNQSLNTNGNFTINFGNLVNVAAGAYDIEVVGNNGNETQKRTIRVVVNHSNFSNNPSVLQFPINGKKGVLSSKTSLVWQKNLNAKEYTLQVSNSPAFTNIAYTATVNSTSFELENLQSGTVYYWRIKPKNDCSEGNYSTVYSFQTGFSDCSNVYTATDFANASGQSFSSNQTFYVPIEITDNLLISSIKVTADVAHTEVDDLTVKIIEPTINGTTEVVLLSKACDETADISNVTFEDNGTSLVCNATAPAISGSVKPTESLSSFTGKMSKGTWVFEVNDFNLFVSGKINAASITVCASIENINIPTFTSSVIKINTNSAYTITAANMEATSASETAIEQLYTLVEKTTKGQLQKDGVALNIGDTFTQADISSNKIKFVNTESTSFTDQFKVDIKNAANGWLANQVITIEENTLSLNSFSLENVSLWPNPTNDLLNVKLNTITNENIVVTVFDLQGREIVTSSSKPVNQIFTKEISTKHFASGVYLLSVQQGNKKATKKIIISK